MALKTLMLRRKIDTKKTELNALREKDAEFKKREEGLTAAVDEATTDDDQAAVDKEIEKYDKELTEHENQKTGLENEIADLEKDLAEEEERSAQVARKQETPVSANKERSINQMNTRTKFFGMTMEQRDRFFAEQEVKDFLERTRQLGGQHRAISGAELTIPTIVLDLIKEVSMNYSKLYKHVAVRHVSGNARQVIMGTIPEGVWTEMCATLNELSLTFNDVEVDGYKVGGYIAICNAILEDSDIALATEIVSALGQAIGLALDKAIIYGTGTKMPLGIVTRLAQTTKPADLKASARWKDLHTSNILSISGKTGIELFKALVIANGAMTSKYSTGSKFWVMNEKTHSKLTAEALGFNAAGAIVSGVNSEMPIVGGTIEDLEFMPDDVVVGGYDGLYLLAERAGASIAQSEHVRFLEEQTVFKGSARFDGVPAIPEGFAAIGIAGNTPTANAVTFVLDTANTPVGE